MLLREVGIVCLKCYLADASGETKEPTEAPLFTTTNLAIIVAVATPIAVTVAIILILKKKLRLQKKRGR